MQEKETNLFELEKIIETSIKKCGIYEHTDIYPCTSGNGFGERTYNEIRSKKINNKKETFCYFDKRIFLSLDENWNIENTKNFLNICLYEKQIIDALNDNIISISIHIFENRHLFHQEFNSNEEKNKYIIFARELLNILENIGINNKKSIYVFGFSYEEFEHLL